MKEISCGRSRGHKSYSIDLKIGQNVCLDEILDEFEFQMKEISCGRSRGHITCSIDLKIGENLCLGKI